MSFRRTPTLQIPRTPDGGQWAALGTLMRVGHCVLVAFWNVTDLLILFAWLRIAFGHIARPFQMCHAAFFDTAKSARMIKVFGWVGKGKMNIRKLHWGNGQVLMSQSTGGGWGVN